MARDDLNEPLGFQSGTDVSSDSSGAPSKQAAVFGRWLAAGVGLLALGSGFYLLTTNKDAPDGEPRAISTIERLPPPVALSPVANEGNKASASVANGVEVTGSIHSLTAARSEEQSGVKVVRAGDGKPSGALIIEIPQQFSVHLTPAPDKKLIENSHFGPLPKISANGVQASQLYARPLIDGKLSVEAPKIAILVGGLGLSQRSTREAIDRLPGAVTLGFAPYGETLERDSAAARDSGHETILQVPMEGLDPSTVPGPHMLRLDHNAQVNLDDLHWMMGRSTGYVGIAGFLGAKFMADRTAFQPIMQDIGNRGLLYFDDDSAPQSLSAALAQEASVAYVHADMQIDKSLQPEAIAAALERLEVLARSKGMAVATANALPASIEQISNFTSGLERRGVLLVPVSALAVKSVRITSEQR